MKEFSTKVPDNILQKTTTNTIMMVRPAHFGYNEETATNNAFQHKARQEDREYIRDQAIEEFDNFVATLRSNGITVEVIQDTDDVVKPDAVFPNNWVSFHESGQVITYPMHAVKRRLERQQSIIDQIGETYQITSSLHYEHLEDEATFLEGTGSMIFDRYHKVAYACASDRTDQKVFHDFCEIMEYQPLWFHSVDHKDMPIYHTNVMMCVGVSFVIICLESIKDNNERKEIITMFQKTHKEIIQISLNQVSKFAGNMIQLRNAEGVPFLVMSSQAYTALLPEQIEQIEQYTAIIHSPLPTIETYGGGSARCMIAEIFLNKK